MASYATSADVQAVWRPLTDSEIEIVDAQLAFASTIIRSQVPTVDARIAAGTLDEALVAGVAVAMVRRFMVNPDGIRQEAIEDYSYTRDSALSAGSVYLSDAELALLRGRRRGAFSVAPQTEPATCATYERVAALRARRLCP